MKRKGPKWEDDSLNHINISSLKAELKDDSDKLWEYIRELEMEIVSLRARNANLEEQLLYLQPYRGSHGPKE